MFTFLIALWSFVLLFVVAAFTGFLSFEEPESMDECAPINVFVIDNMLCFHLKGIGGFILETWFAITFVKADGDTASRSFGWSKPVTFID